MDLANKVVVVTGASKGIGAATARELHARGAQVALLGRDVEALKQVAGPMGDRAAWFVAEITDHESLQKAAAGVEERFGRVDVLFANAGLNRAGTIRTAHADVFAEIVDTNLIGTYRTVQVFLPALMKTKGYALLMSSISSSIAPGGMTAYAASKSGVESMARTLRMETAHLGVKIGAVHPWFAETALLHDGEDAMPTFAKTRARLAIFGKIPGPIGLIGLTLTPERCGTEIADMIEARSRKRHVPRNAGLLAFAKPAINSGVGERIQQLGLGWMMKRFDEETRGASK